MGRIKTQQIKSKGNELYDLHGKRFSKDFDENKKVLEQVATVHSKKLRNILAGYLTRKVKNNGGR